MRAQHQNSSPSHPGSSNSEIYKCAEQTKNLSEKVRAFYKENQFDIVLVAEIDNIKVHSHKIVLSTSSEFFYGMFRSGMKEATSDEIKFKEIDGKTLTSIVDFMYTSSIELHNESVESVFRAAGRFQMNNLMALCSDFIVKRLDSANCLDIVFLAEQHNATALCKTATLFALKHFETVCKEGQFFNLNQERLNALISSDDLFVSSEENVFLSLVAWVEYDRENREALILDIFSKVRFTSLKPKFIIENRRSICKTVECYELISSWLQWHLSPESRSELPIMNAKPRKTNTKIALVSGEHTNDLKLQIFDRDLNTWSVEELPRSSKNRREYRSIAINKKLIVAGGLIGDLPTNTVECYNFELKTWTDLPSMGCARILPGIAELNGELYVVGGSDDGRSVEKYDFAIGKWQEVAPLLTPLTYPQVVVLEGLLYTAGIDESLVDCYDPEVNQWTRKEFRSENSTHFGFAAVNGYLYTVGGHYNGGVSRIVERFQPSTKIRSLEQGQSYMLCAGLNNRLIACRGYDGRNHLDLVQEYDPETNEWTTLSSVVPYAFERLSSSLFTIQIHSQS